MINKKQSEIIKKWDINYQKPEVSIRCITYNHAGFIEKALDSFLMQETTFPFEIIVHDDASTDGTKQIIEKYEKEYPLIIKPIYEIENQYSKNIGKISNKINKLMEGKYIAFCEGDDYWIDANKLQKQYDFMEKNEKYCLCTHNTKKYDIKKKKYIENFNKLIIDKELTEKEVFFGWNVHTSSFFIKKEIYFSFPVFKNSSKYWFGDYMILCWCLFFGGIYYLSDIMSVYDMNNINGVTLLNDDCSEDIKYEKTKLLIDFLQNYNEYTKNIYYKHTKERIDYEKLHCEMILGNYRKIVESYEYEEAFNKIKIKQKIYILLRAYFPNLYKNYKRIKCYF